MTSRPACLAAIYSSNNCKQCNMCSRKQGSTVGADQVFPNLRKVLGRILL